MNKVTFQECLDDLVNSDFDRDPKIIERMKNASPELQERFVDAYCELCEEIKKALVELYNEDKDKFDKIKSFLVK